MLIACSSSDDGATSEPDGGPVVGTGPDAAPAPDRPDAAVPGEPAEPDAAFAANFREIDGLVVMEGENYTLQDNNDEFASVWYTFALGVPDPTVECVTNTVCTPEGPGTNRPNCNEHPNCDGDNVSPAEAGGNAYVEALPDRRRNDEEANTGNLGFTDSPQLAPTLRYSVEFTQVGRYYAWARSRNGGRASNGLHLGVDGTWPRNELVAGEESGMRWQFGRTDFAWTQNRRGAQTHVGGVPAQGGVTRRDANVWIDIATPGVHDVMIGMREDGLEFDKLILALDPTYQPPDDDGPAETR